MDLFFFFLVYVQGILSKSLMIAPPDAPVTGYMFGKARHIFLLPPTTSIHTSNACRLLLVVRRAFTLLIA